MGKKKGIICQVLIAIGYFSPNVSQISYALNIFEVYRTIGMVELCKFEI